MMSTEINADTAIGHSDLPIEEVRDDGEAMAVDAADEPKALLVQLAVDDDARDTEREYAEHCFESRNAFRELFVLHAGRGLRNAGPLAQNNPSIIVTDPEDQRIVFGLGMHYGRIILSIVEIDATVHLAEEFRPKEKRKKRAKKPKGIGFGTMSDGDDDDDLPRNNLINRYTNYWTPPSLA